MFYQDLVNELSNGAGGVQINNKSYVFCYADDLILTSVTGLQTLLSTESTIDIHSVTWCKFQSY